jgi:SAM-dependent methyltransferase
MAAKAIRDGAELEEIFKQADQITDAAKQIGFLSQYYLEYRSRMPADPYGPEYIDAVMDTYRGIGGRPNYTPGTDERAAPGSLRVGQTQPQPFGISDSSWVGEGWMAWGFILSKLKLTAGQRTIEYGAGFGAMSLALARNGCDVTVVDVEPEYLEWVELQARDVGTKVTTLHGVFGDTPPNHAPYDAVIFLESFHHCIPHAQLLIDLHEKTTSSGIVCLGDEPVFAPDDYWAPTTPFPWGPRLDLVSIRAARQLGWMELGFQESYLIDAMLRAGWAVEKHVCPMTRRGTCHIGRKTHGALKLADTLLPDICDRSFHSHEGLGRWTRGEGRIDLPISSARREAVVEIVSYSPKPVTVRIASESARAEASLTPGVVSEIAVAVPEHSRTLTISSPTFIPNKVLKNGDEREIGVFVREVRWRTLAN